MSPEEVEILAVERKLARAESEARTLWREIQAVRQGLMEAEGLVSQAATCLTTLNGTVRGCNALPVVGASLTLTLRADGSILWTGTTDSAGAFAATATIDAAGGVVVDLTTSFGSRFTTSTRAATLNCGPATLSTTTLSPAAGYHCGRGAVPISNNLLVTDSYWGGPWPLTYNPVPGETDLFWIAWPFPTVNYPACGGQGCPAAPGLPLIYQYSPTTFGFTVGYRTRGLGLFDFCPQVNGPRSASVGLTLQPGATGPPTLHEVYKPGAQVGGNYLYCGIDPNLVTVTVEEA
jgi:hypothetical protein